jgi:hypothetical protein
MKKIVRHVPARTTVSYQCEVCESRYRSKAQAKKCEARIFEKQMFRRGDHVICRVTNICDCGRGGKRGFLPKGTVAQVIGPQRADEEYAIKWLHRTPNMHVYQYVLASMCPFCERERECVCYAPELKKIK